MTFPGSFDKVTITGSYVNLTGSTADGTVTFTPDSGTWLTATAAKTVIVPEVITAKLVNGSFSVDLPAITDDADIKPTGGTYKVVESIAGKTRTYSIQVNVGEGPIDLSQKAPAQPVTATYTMVRSINGKPADTATGNVTLTAADLGVDPGVVDGDLRVGGAGRTGIDVNAGTLPYGPTSTVANTGLAVGSSYPSDDVVGGVDGTGRINLYSYQRANVGSFGETIRQFIMRADAKAMEAWYVPRQKYDPVTREPVGTSWQAVTWTGSHYEANDHGSIHGHWEIEIPDSTGALQGRFEVPFIDQSKLSNGLDNTVIGLDWTNIRTNLADFSVRAQNITKGDYTGQNTALRVGGNNSVNKDILLSISSDMQNSGRRWIIRANTDAEAGSADGTNFQLVRTDNNGAIIGTAMFIRRSDGLITLGASSALGARMAAVWGANGVHGFSAQPSASPGAGAGFDAQMFAATDRAYQANVTGDVNRRFVIYADGKHEWGDGVGGRDTNLYRATGDTLKTDDSFHVGATFRHLGASLGFYNAAPVAKPTVSGSRADGTALDSLLTALASLGLIDNTAVA